MAADKVCAIEDAKKIIAHPNSTARAVANPSIHYSTTVPVTGTGGSRTRSGGGNNNADGDAGNISRRLFELIHSQNGTDNIRWLVAIDHLIDASPTTRLLTQPLPLLQHVKHLLLNPDPALILAASKTLGHY
ncbi:hypothetical protein C8R47DRAFT_1205870 [Mycena vitilis]|nr:hypothetical protein C8R47DRAFT_1205870 [Mycena vitilis]